MIARSHPSVSVHVAVVSFPTLDFDSIVIKKKNLSTKIGDRVRMLCLL